MARVGSKISMMQLNGNEIQSLDKIYRLNLINSVTGIKPANLIGTKNSQGIENLAIFSSVVHLGSNPPLIGMVTRPTDEVPRHTYSNIQESGIYTINAVNAEMTKEAHYTSAKFDAEESEFKECGFIPEYVDGFDAPFVKQSKLKMGLKLVDQYPIRQNGTILLVGEIQHLIVADDAITSEGYLQLDKLNVAGISGLNSYYQLNGLATYPYARVEGFKGQS